MSAKSKKAAAKKKNEKKNRERAALAAKEALGQKKAAQAGGNAAKGTPEKPKADSSKDKKRAKEQKQKEKQRQKENKDKEKREKRKAKQLEKARLAKEKEQALKEKLKNKQSKANNIKQTAPAKKEKPVNKAVEPKEDKKAKPGKPEKAKPDNSEQIKADAGQIPAAANAAVITAETDNDTVSAESVAGVEREDEVFITAEEAEKKLISPLDEILNEIRGSSAAKNAMEQASLEDTAEIHDEEADEPETPAVVGDGSSVPEVESEEVDSEEADIVEAEPVGNDPCVVPSSDDEDDNDIEEDGERNPTTANEPQGGSMWSPLPFNMAHSENIDAPLEAGEEDEPVGNDPCVVPSSDDDDEECNPTTADAVPLPFNMAHSENIDAPLEVEEENEPVVGDGSSVPDEESDDTDIVEEESSVPEDEPEDQALNTENDVPSATMANLVLQALTPSQDDAEETIVIEEPTVELTEEPTVELTEEPTEKPAQLPEPLPVVYENPLVQLVLSALSAPQTSALEPAEIIETAAPTIESVTPMIESLTPEGTVTTPDVKAEKPAKPPKEPKPKKEKPAKLPKEPKPKKERPVKEPKPPRQKKEKRVSFKTAASMLINKATAGMKEKSANLSQKTKALIAVAAVAVLLVVVAAAAISVFSYKVPANAVPVYMGRTEPGVNVRDIEVGQEEQLMKAGETPAKGSRAFKFFAYTNLTIDEWYDEVPLVLGNVQTNTCDFIVTILDKDDIVLYRSMGIKPGKYLPYFKLFAEQPYGEYDLTVVVAGYNPQTFENVGVKYMKLKLVIGFEQGTQKETGQTE